MFLGPYTFDGLNDTVDLPVPNGPATIMVQVIGTSTQTIELQDSLDDGTTYTIVNLFSASNDAFAASITTTGFFYKLHYDGGLVRPRLRNTAFTSGSWTVYVNILPYAL